MQESIRRQISDMEKKFPAYQVWRSAGPKGPRWCARRWDGTRAVLNASSPDVLEHHIETDVEELT
jgi:hypothetical protein